MLAHHDGEFPLDVAAQLRERRVLEARLRWNHPIRRLLTPDSFVSMGEAHGLCRATMDFVLQRGIEQLNGGEAQRLRIGLRSNFAVPPMARE